MLYLHSFVSQRDVKGITPHFTKASLANTVQFPFATVWMDIMDGRSGTLSYQGLVSYCLSAVPHSYLVRAEIYRLYINIHHN